MYTPGHTHTHIEWAYTTCSDFGFLFSHCIHKACICARTHLHYYANSPYTIFVTRTHTHTHTHSHTHTHHTHEHTQAHTTCSDINWVLIFTLLSRSVHVHECAHTLLCTQPVHPIFITHTAHTHIVHLHCYGN